MRFITIVWMRLTQTMLVENTCKRKKQYESNGLQMYLWQDKMLAVYLCINILCQKIKLRCGTNVLIDACNMEGFQNIHSQLLLHILFYLFHRTDLCLDIHCPAWVRKRWECFFTRSSTPKVATHLMGCRNYHWAETVITEQMWFYGKRETRQMESGERLKLSTLADIHTRYRRKEFYNSLLSVYRLLHEVLHAYSCRFL